MPKILTLSEADQLTLAGVLLVLMERDIAQERDTDVSTGQIGIRNNFRFLLRQSIRDGRSGHEALDIEDPEVLERRLTDVESEAHGVQIAIEAAGYQPWLTEALNEKRRQRLHGDTREETLDWVVNALPGETLQRSEVERQLFGSSVRRGAIFAGVGVVGLAAGVATAGLAAPAIGAAIGGTMGLSGAAATSAGLAWLGGGALAAGGSGMAGGTLLLGALGAAGGGGLGLFAGHQGKKAMRAQAKFERRKLRALIRICADERRLRTTKIVAREQEAALEQEIATLLARRAEASEGQADPVTEQDEDLTRAVELRRYVGASPFPVMTC